MKVTFEHKYQALSALLTEIQSDELLSGEQLMKAVHTLDGMVSFPEHSDDVEMIIDMTEILYSEIY